MKLLQAIKAWRYKGALNKRRLALRETTNSYYWLAHSPDTPDLVKQVCLLYYNVSMAFTVLTEAEYIIIKKHY